MHAGVAFLTLFINAALCERVLIRLGFAHSTEDGRSSSVAGDESVCGHMFGIACDILDDSSYKYISALCKDRFFGM